MLHARDESYGTREAIKLLKFELACSRANLYRVTRVKCPWTIIGPSESVRDKRVKCPSSSFEIMIAKDDS